MFNEPSSTLREYSNNQVYIQNNHPTDQLRQVVSSKNIQETNLSNGHYSAQLPGSQGGNNSIGVDPNNDCSMAGFCIDFNKSSKLIDDEIDKISISSEEDFTEIKKNNIDVETYEKEMNKISELYMNEDNDESMNKYVGTKNELSELKVIPTVFQLEETFNFLVAGNVVTKVIEGKFTMIAETTNGVLDLDNIIFNMNKLPVGYVDDVLGKIDSPLYVIKLLPDYKGSQDLSGEKLYVVKEKVKFVNKQELLKFKGSDASNAFDEEVDEDEMEFSDDDEESKRKERNRKKKNESTKRQVQTTTDYSMKTFKEQTSSNQHAQQFFYNNSIQNKTNCQEYKLNTNFAPQNTNMFSQNFSNNYVQQQQFFQQPQMPFFNPGSMFSPYQQAPVQNHAFPNVQLNSQFFTQVNPFIQNNLNNK